MTSASSRRTAPATLGAEVETDYLLGIAKADGQVKLLLDIDQVLSSQEVVALHTAADDSTSMAAEETAPVRAASGPQAHL